MSKALITEQTLTDIANNMRSNGASGQMTPAEMSAKVKDFFPLDVFFTPNPFNPIKDEITIHLLAYWDNSYKLQYTRLAKKINLIFDLKSDHILTNHNCSFLLYNAVGLEEAVVDISYRAPTNTTNMFSNIDTLKKITVVNNGTVDNIFEAGRSFADAYSTDDNRNSLEEVIGTDGGKYIGIGSNAFHNQTKLKDTFFKNNKAVSIGSGAFSECRSFIDVDCSSFFSKSYLDVDIEEKAFYFKSGTEKMKSMYLPVIHTGKKYKIGSQALFSSKMECLIILSDVLSTIQYNSFNDSSPIKQGTGFVYVPDALVDSYKKATNWVTIADQIKPISDLPQEYKTIYGL